MAITINWFAKVIFVPKADLALVQASPEIREMNLNNFRLALKDLEDSEAGMLYPDTHRHNTEVSMAGITLARVIEIINGYTVTLEDGQYAVNLVGANSNVAEVANVNQVSLRSQNSSGLIVSESADINSILQSIGVALMDNENIETGLTFRQSQRLLSAALAGALSGATSGSNLATIRIKNAVADDKERIVAETDQYGNRTAITYDLE